MTAGARLARAFRRGPGLGDGAPRRWLDAALAAAVLVALEAEALTSSHRHGPLALNMIAVAVMAAAAIWRRSAPLAFLVVVGVLADALSGGLQSLTYPTLTGFYIVLVPAYSVAAWAGRRRAVTGLVIWIGGVSIAAAIEHAPVADLAASAATASVLWVAGRVIRSWRELTLKLRHASERLTAEGDDRWRLAVAGERTRIARDLHAVVAQNVATMVVQARAAQQLLGGDAGRADAAISAVEEIGRDALTEMRRMLGVLRRPEDTRQFEPQPGVDQIHLLIQQARDRGQPVNLNVEGEPGIVPAVADVGIYRILEEGLASSAADLGRALAVTIVFGEDDLELRVSADCRTANTWPTPSMQEWAALCGGYLHVTTVGGACHLIARMPRRLQGAPT